VQDPINEHIVEVKELPRSFWQELPGAFIYPFRGWGLSMLGAMVLCFWALTFISCLPIVPTVASLILTVFLMGYLTEVAAESARGDDTPPNPANVGVFSGDVWGTIFRFVAVGFLAGGPLLVYTVFLAADVAAEPNVALAYALLGWSLLYLPMGLLLAAFEEGFGAINPIKVVVAIARVPVAYAACCALGFLAVGGGLVVSGALTELTVAGALLGYPLVIYGLIVQMHLMGLLYCHRGHRFGWEPQV
jgi:hypothetical protein